MSFSGPWSSPALSLTWNLVVMSPQCPPVSNTVPFVLLDLDSRVCAYVSPHSPPVWVAPFFFFSWAGGGCACERNTQRGCCVILSGVRDVSIPTTGDVTFGSVNAGFVMAWLKSAVLVFVFSAFPLCLVRGRGQGRGCLKCVVSRSCRQLHYWLITGASVSRVALSMGLFTAQTLTWQDSNAIFPVGLVRTWFSFFFFFPI